MADGIYTAEDARKAHEYYERTKKLKGRDKKNQNDTPPPKQQKKLDEKAAKKKEVDAKVSRLKGKIASLERGLSEALAALSAARAAASKKEKASSDGKSTEKEKQNSQEYRDKNQAKIKAEEKKESAKEKSSSSTSSSSSSASSSSSTSVSDMSVSELESRVSRIRKALGDAKKQLASSAQESSSLAHSQFMSNEDIMSDFGLYHTKERKPVTMATPDFGGYVTSYNKPCKDGRIILDDAFKDDHGQTVPLVFQHGHNDIKNVLGYMELESRPLGTYGHGYLNGTPEGLAAKEQIRHGDLKYLSIFANDLIEKAQGTLKAVVHGAIREVSLVLAGANPGAFIDNVNIVHGDGTNEALIEAAYITTGLEIEPVVSEETLAHAATATEEMDLDEILDTYDEVQRNALQYLVVKALEKGRDDALEETKDESEDELKQTGLTTPSFVIAPVLEVNVEDNIVHATARGEKQVDPDIAWRKYAEATADSFLQSIKQADFVDALKPIAVKYGIKDVKNDRLWAAKPAAQAEAVAKFTSMFNARIKGKVISPSGKLKGLIGRTGPAPYDIDFKIVPTGMAHGDDLAEGDNLAHATARPDKAITEDDIWRRTAVSKANATIKQIRASAKGVALRDAWRDKSLSTSDYVEKMNILMRQALGSNNTSPSGRYKVVFDNDSQDGLKIVENPNVRPNAIVHSDLSEDDVKWFEGLEDLTASFEDETKDLLSQLVSDKAEAYKVEDPNNEESWESNAPARASLLEGATKIYNSIAAEKGTSPSGEYRVEYVEAEDVVLPAVAHSDSSLIHSDTLDSGDAVQHNDIQKGTQMNVFDQAKTAKTADGEVATLSHADVGNIMKAVVDNGSKLSQELDNYALAHGIENIQYLMPDAKTLENTPQWDARRQEWVAKVLDTVRKAPFSKIRSIVADITADEARAKGYITGNLKEEEFFTLIRRETTPQTIYKKQRLNRDDVIDITDLDVVAFIKFEMKLMLDEELAGAILIGDGRSSADDEKIREENIRPIATDAELYATKVNLNLDDANSSVDELLDAVIANRQYYKGSGTPTFYTSENVIAKFLNLKDGYNRRMYSSLAEVATVMRVADIVPVDVFDRRPELVGIMVNLVDYTIGTTAGGQATMFDDFDLNYNKLIWLLEARLSGALTKPRAAVVFNKVAASLVLVQPDAPAFDKAQNRITVPTKTGVVYKNAANGATLTTGSPVTVTSNNSPYRVVATPDTGYYFADNKHDEFTYTYQS